MLRRAVCFVALLPVACNAGAHRAQTYDLGREPAAAMVAPQPIEPNGTGLPTGHGSAADGERLYAVRCANCHDTPAFPQLWGGIGSLAKAPQKTVGSYWPYAPAVYDYIARAMPPKAPGSLRPDEVYALTAFILARNGIIPASATLDAAGLARIVMPNHAGFFTAEGKPDTE